MSGFFPWQPAASAYGRQIDLLAAAFGTMVWLLAIPVFVLMAVFAWRYRRTREVNRQNRPNGNVWVEASWSVIPFLMILVFYVWATSLYLDLRQPPEDAVTIDVVAKQWMWKFQHPEGAREINDLHVPVGTPIKLVMTSQDVIHSLYLPALRIKQDVVPGRYSTLWFTADRAGAYPLRCAEFCGADHSVMGGKLIVMEAADFAAWQAAHNGNGALSAAERGARLYRTSGCAGCHDRTQEGLAPALSDIFGRQVVLADGSRTRADEQYLRDAIMLPNKQVVAGFRGIMPSYAASFSAEEVADLVAFLKSAPSADGRIAQP
ncbi:cytochrome b561 [Altererythrobacter sp. B11]|uniref:cytochrome c oxidase subunit II n=1 Tax=Altererythrobacter sp. B11 TaxID=2060312 RepID=UPI000DC70AC2|nr:cytochrome c oxidase subunit II [Altererythrobacter sp. B11]BBC72777.1 cytochrome b561 [Altererythrobacter sp. B11]